MTTQESYKIYVLLTRTGTKVSKLINKATKAPVTHSSLCVDPHLTEFYSFGRYHPRFVLPGGFVKETLSSGVFGNCPNAPCVLLEARVSKEGYWAARELIDRFAKNKLRYDVLGFFYNYYGMKRDVPDKYICSRFVAQTLALSDAIIPKKHASLYQPVDFLDHEELSCVFKGTIKELQEQLLQGTLPLREQSFSCHEHEQTERIAL